MDVHILPCIEEYNTLSDDNIIKYSYIFNLFDNRYISFTTWLKAQNTPKAWTLIAAATLYSGYYNSIEESIKNALALDENYLPAYKILVKSFNYVYSKQYPAFITKIKINPSDVMKVIDIPEMQNECYTALTRLYFRQKDLTNFINYFSKSKTNLLSREIKDMLSYICKNDISIKLCFKIFSNDIKDFKCIANLLDEIKKLREENKALRALPGGPEYQEALSRFDEMREAP